jgi:hypothetical protein
MVLTSNNWSPYVKPAFSATLLALTEHTKMPPLFPGAIEMPKVSFFSI